jgi:hypothetical protein
LKKFFQTFQKTLPETALRFQKGFPLLCIKRFQCFGSYKPALRAGLCMRLSERALVGGLVDDIGITAITESEMTDIFGIYR